MNDPLTRENCDALLLPFLQAHDPSVGENLLSNLITEHADPVISKIIKSKMRVSLDEANGDQLNQDALAMASGLRAMLISDLREIQQHSTRKTIKSFRDYVAIKTYSECADYFREMNPRRWRLKNLLRHQLKQNPQFALWKVDNNYWCAGLSEWRNAKVFGELTKPLPPAASIRDRLSRLPNQNAAASELLTTVFEHQGHPVQFERLVSLAAEVWRITDFQAESLDVESVTLELTHPSPQIDLLLEQRTHEALLPSKDELSFHLSKAELTSYLSGTYDEAVGVTYTSHLENCEKCQAESHALSEAAALPTSARAPVVERVPERSVWAGWSGLTPARAAAVVVILAILAFALYQWRTSW